MKINNSIIVCIIVVIILVGIIIRLATNGGKLMEQYKYSCEDRKANYNRCMQGTYSTDESCRSSAGVGTCPI